MNTQLPILLLVLSAAVLLTSACRWHGHRERRVHALSDRDVEHALAHVELSEDERGEVRAALLELAEETRLITATRDLLRRELELEWRAESFDAERIKGLVRRELEELGTRLEGTADTVARLHATLPPDRRGELLERRGMRRRRR